MKSDVEENAGKVCIRCGTVNEPGASRCEECGAPMDDFAASCPWEMGTAKGNAYHAVDPVKKPIIFWGVWLYFGPTAFISMWMITDILRSHFKGVESVGIFGGVGLMALILPALFSALSIWVLCSVSKRYLKGKRK